MVKFFKGDPPLFTIKYNCDGATTFNFPIDLATYDYLRDDSEKMEMRTSASFFVRGDLR
ncbi:MAG: hypothetical protein Kow0069_18660 [Promethearchaeota archaeon]